MVCEREKRSKRCRETPPHAPSSSSSSASLPQTMATQKKPGGRLKLPSHPSAVVAIVISVLLVLIDELSSTVGTGLLTILALELSDIRRSRRASSRPCCTLGRVRSSRSRIRTCGSVRTGGGAADRPNSAEWRRDEMEGAAGEIGGCERKEGLVGEVGAAGGGDRTI